MKTVVLAATKGGVGKSTLTTAFAVAAVNAGGDPKQLVGMLDQDSAQGSVTLWWGLRGEVDNPRVYSGASTIAEAVETLTEHGLDWLIIDTGPANLKSTLPCLMAADLVVVPVKPSAFDLTAVDPILDAIRSVNKPYIMVLNEIDPRSPKMAVTARQYLETLGHRVAAQTIAQRMPYRAALTNGQTGPEVDRDGKCSAEINALWSEVSTLANGGKTRG
jgi:chromosome partitioning protein